MKEHFEQLQGHKRIARGWKIWSVTPTSELRWVYATGNLQQLCAVRWRHDHEQHVGGGYYTRDETTSEWLNIPIVKLEDNA